MATYCTDADLVKYRPNIMQLGVNDWNEQHTEAYALINRIVEVRWYRKVAEEMGYDWRDTQFDPDLVEDGQLTRLECFKVLELAYEFLQKETPEPDGFARLASRFRKRYIEELDMVLSGGITYDWNDDDAIDTMEYAVEGPRRQHRA